MPKFTCPSCAKSFALPAVPPSAGRVECPHCHTKVALPESVFSKVRWYCVHQKKKYGPYSWQQLLSLVESGRLRPDDLLLQEGAKQCVHARSLQSLFGAASSDRTTQTLCATDDPPTPSPRQNSWLMMGLIGAGVSILLALGVIAGSAYFGRTRPNELQPTGDEPISLESQNNTPTELAKKDDPSKKQGDPARKEEVKPPQQDKKLMAPPKQTWEEQVIDPVNRARKVAGLGSVTLDENLSRSCLAHAQYLAKNIDAVSTSTANVQDEDPSKPGFKIGRASCRERV